MRLTALPLSAVLLLGLAFAADNPIPNPGFETLDQSGWAQGWGRYNWGPEGSEGAQQVEVGLAHSGRNSLQGINRSATAAAGAYTHVPLTAGSWELSFWARAETGKAAAVRCYLATSYSRSYPLTDQWTRIRFVNTLLSPVERAEINIQNASGEVGTIWFDDVTLSPSVRGSYAVVRDTRPLQAQPRLLYFDAHLASWADRAAEWKARGFAGTFCSYIYGDIHDDPWAADKDPATRGEDDRLLQECRAANDKCLAAGLDSNALKVAFYRDLPDPYDDDGYGRITRNFRQAARFARMAHFPCLAIDTEYTAYQFDPAWKGYDLAKHSPADLAQKLAERWKTIAEVMLREYPEVDLLVLPEGSLHYGPLWNAVFGGLIEGLAARRHPRGIHLFCESSYTRRDPLGLAELAADVKETTARKLPVAARDYWNRHGEVALGCWPLGYYRAITDKQGKFLGWSGKQAVFGDRLVGSYADKSENYPLAEFRVQLAAARTFSGRYCWIYGHGASWFGFTAEEDKRYKSVSLQHYGSENYVLPTVANIAEYYATAAAREMVRLGE